MQTIRGGRVKVQPDKRKRKVASPLDCAKGHEVVWPQVSPLFQAVRGLEGAKFVYFVGEGEGGPMKIGVAKDPIQRLRGMQTGNSRRLRIEYVLLGTSDTEKLLHEMWEAFAIRSPNSRGDAPLTEWFQAGIREQLVPIIKTAVGGQVAWLAANAGVDLEELDSQKIVRDAHVVHDFVVQGRDTPRLLANTMGYVAGRRSRL